MRDDRIVLSGPGGEVCDPRRLSEEELLTRIEVLDPGLAAQIRRDLCATDPRDKARGLKLVKR